MTFNPDDPGEHRRKTVSIDYMSQFLDSMYESDVDALEEEGGGGFLSAPWTGRVSCGEGTLTVPSDKKPFIELRFKAVKGIPGAGKTFSKRIYMSPDKADDFIKELARWGIRLSDVLGRDESGKARRIRSMADFEPICKAFAKNQYTIKLAERTYNDRFSGEQKTATNVYCNEVHVGDGDNDISADDLPF